MNAPSAPALVAGAPFSMWLGRNHPEAVAAFRRARLAGMSLTRSLVVGQIASFRDCWAFRRNIARLLGVSIRTVQRAISQAKSLGLIKVWRSNKNERTPPSEQHPRGLLFASGWSHKIAVGLGKAGRELAQAIDAARLRFISRAAVAVTVARSKASSSPARAPSSPSSVQPRQRQPRWSDGRLDAELARVAPQVIAARARDGPDDD